MSPTSARFGRVGNDDRCTVIMQMGGLPVRSGEAMSKDIYAAFDAALAKVAKQLPRTKRALHDNQGFAPKRGMVLRAWLGGSPSM
jgi:ribosome-associated translation inhibitor RaiA